LQIKTGAIRLLPLVPLMAIGTPGGNTSSVLVSGGLRHQAHHSFRDAVAGIHQSELFN
jgi:hypothetical protein